MPHPTGPIGPGTPRICAVIPAYREEPTIGRSLESILAAGLSPEDVFVIDDCSEDRTGEIAAGMDVTVIRNPSNRGKSASVERALREGRLLDRYGLVAFLDADTLVDPAYFRTVRAAAAEHPEVALFVGQVKSLRHNWVTSSRALDYTYMHDVYKEAQSMLSVVTVGPGCASVYRAGALRRIRIEGGTLAEDMDWTFQVYRNGLGRTLYVREAVVWTQDPATLRDYVNQVRRWYVGAWQVILKNRVPFGGMRIDAEAGLLAFEALVYSLFVAILPVVSPILVLYAQGFLTAALLGDAAVFSSLAVYAAVKNRRADILRTFPLFYLLRYLNAVVYLESFAQVYLRKERTATWYKVSRYFIG